MQIQELGNTDAVMKEFSSELALNKKFFSKAWLVVIWEELEATLATNLEIFQQMFKDLEYKQFCQVISHLENGWVCTIDLNSIQEIAGFPFPSLIRRFESVSLEDIRDDVEHEFREQNFDQMDVYMDAK